MKNSMNSAAMPPVLPGFEDISRHWDQQEQRVFAKILPGEFYVSKRGEVLSTVLGSCVSACIRDPYVGVGGMNHFMLPVQGEGGLNPPDESARYGNWAMEFLINEILKHGGSKQRLEVKIIGGGKVLKNFTNIGERNVDFVREYLIHEGLDIVAENTGDVFPRRLLYYTENGKVRVKKLRSEAMQKIDQEESACFTFKSGHPPEGSVELF